MNLNHLHFHSLYLLSLILFYNYFTVHAQPVASDRHKPEETHYLKLGVHLSRPIAVLIILLLFIFFLIVFFSVYLRHYLELTAASDAILRAASADRFGFCHGLDPVVIRTFPVVAHSELKETKIARWSLECAVCLNEFQHYETLRLLPKCGHVFHPNCIDAWLASCATCPVCRAKLVADSAAGEISESEFVAICVDDGVDRNGDEDSSEALETCSNGEVLEMELDGGGNGDKSIDVAGGEESEAGN